MTDSILTRFKTKREHDIIYKPRSGDEMEEATLHHAPVYKYSDLCKQSETEGIEKTIWKLFKKSNKNIILLQDPHDMDSGHWIAVERVPSKKEIYFFSTYGGRPDEEKIRWMKEDDLRESNQFLNFFSKGLRRAQEHGWEIHYNNYPFQKEGDETATCGIYTAAFLRSDLNPDEFKNETLKLMKRNINPAIFYFDKYFY